MSYDEELALRVRQSLGDETGIVERKMFGGLCFMAHGNMLGGVMGDEIIVRVGADRYEDALKQPHAREMDFTGRRAASWSSLRKGLHRTSAWMSGCGEGCNSPLPCRPSKCSLCRSAPFRANGIPLICSPYLSIIG